MNLIQQEMSGQDNENWFKRKEKKFLHNIDTFYYTVTFNNDFSKDSIDPSVISLRKYFNSIKPDTDSEYSDTFSDFYIPGTESLHLLYSLRGFAGIFPNCISSVDEFDIFVADTVPNVDTNHILVQLRSNALWLDGINKSFEKSMIVINAIAAYFHLTILEIKENRCDYCFHTNYLQNPETYLRIDNLSKMIVSRFKSISYHYQFTNNDDYENDYIALGKRGDKCFVRMYLKTKEVVEMNYKSFFFHIWLYNGLINRYDFYVLTNLYELRSWKFKDLIRLQFYYEYGQDDYYKQLCFLAMESFFKKGAVNWDYISKLADKLTPRITVVMNVEYQVMRKMSKTFCLLNTKNRSGPDSRVHIFLDNRKMIVDYLTNDTLRLVDRNTALKKSQCNYTAFWEALRRTRMIEVRKTKHDPKLTRVYSRVHDFNLMKTRYIHSAVNLALYFNGTEKDVPVNTALQNNLSLLNDNDIEKAMYYTYKKKRLLGSNFNKPMGDYYE